MSNAIPSSAPGSSPYSVMSWPRLTLGDWFSHGKFLIMPASPETARLAAFQIMQLPLRGGLPTILFEQLLKRVRMYSQTDGSYGAILDRIREFYFYWSGVMPQGEAQGVVERLDRDTQSGALAVFYLEDDPRFTLIRERSGPAVLPRGDDVAGWSVKQRLLAMLDAVPGAALKAFGPTVAAELRAFFSLRNLEIVATIFVLVVAVQAVPVADGAVDIALFSLALAQFGWSGVLTLRDLIAAVVMAARAKNRATIDAAAEKAAQALVSLGVTALLAAVVKRFSEGTLPQKDEASSAWENNQTRSGTQATNGPSRGGSTPGQTGGAGEQAVRSKYDIGESKPIDVNGRTRIPDGITDDTLSEVKNVAHQSLTRQLQDYLDYAQQNDLKFNLYLRPSSTVSGRLQQLIDDGDIVRRDIPQ